MRSQPTKICVWCVQNIRYKTSVSIIHLIFPLLFTFSMCMSSTHSSSLNFPFGCYFALFYTKMLYRHLMNTMTLSLLSIWVNHYLLQNHFITFNFIRFNSSYILILYKEVSCKLLKRVNKNVARKIWTKLWWRISPVRIFILVFGMFILFYLPTTMTNTHECHRCFKQYHFGKMED